MILKLNSNFFVSLFFIENRFGLMFFLLRTGLHKKKFILYVNKLDKWEKWRCNFLQMIKQKERREI